MPLKIIRNNIINMKTDVIVNPTGEQPEIAIGCDSAIYKAAGQEQLLDYRKRYIGTNGIVSEGEAFITQAYNLDNNKYIIHVVSPQYRNGKFQEEEKLRSCYSNALKLAKEYKVKSISFPLIATGRSGYPKKDAMKIAIQEINEFLFENDMLVYLVVFGHTATQLGLKMHESIEAYIDYRTVQDIRKIEYGDPFFASAPVVNAIKLRVLSKSSEDDLRERIEHLSDSFSEHLMYLIRVKDLKIADVYNESGIDKRTFSKIKNGNHPSHLTALCLCIGLHLNHAEAETLLAKAGYALSDSDPVDVIFSYYIDKANYNIYDIDGVLYKQGLPTINKYE